MTEEEKVTIARKTVQKKDGTLVTVALVLEDDEPMRMEYESPDKSLYGIAYVVTEEGFSIPSEARKHINDEEFSLLEELWEEYFGVIKIQLDSIC